MKNYKSLHKYSHFLYNKVERHSLCVSICFILLTVLGHAQQDTLALPKSQIVVTARVKQEGKIMLRWAVTTSRAWRKLNVYGYSVTRYTLTRNNEMLSQPVEKHIGVFKPKLLEEWIPVIEKNNNAAVIAQSIYGDSFNVEGQDQLSAIVNLAEEQEQRFTWGLYAADQDYEAALMAGLAFIDTSVDENEKYVYKVISLVPENILPIEEGGVLVGLKDYEALPKPLDFTGAFLDGKAMLSWNYKIHDQTYNSYFVERSTDGQNFSRLNDLPLTRLNNSDKINSERMFYIDSITNGRTYYYRILGKTIFGELSPVSDKVSGKGETVLAYVPKITTKHYLDDKRIILEWDFLKAGNELITGFELSRSDKVKGNYKVVMKNIPPEARKIQYDNLQPTNYLTITAIGKNGSKRTSFPALVQPVDSIPPAQPKGFKGVVDSLGVVTLKWDANTEKDMLGYRVFRGNNKDEEYTQITIAPHEATVFYDSISVKNLNAKVFYTLIAVDQRFNMSPSSEILELKKPDVIKPTQPVFKAYEIKEGKVYLKWAMSSSDDVIKHEIYRRSVHETDWSLMHTAFSRAFEEKIPKTFKTSKSIVDGMVEDWVDVNVEEDNRYSYTIIAVDDSALESDPISPLTLTIPKTSIPPSVARFDSVVDKQNGVIELYWKPYKEENVSNISIYKGLKGKSISLLCNLLPNVKQVRDYKVKPNNEYTYLIRAVFKDGRVSKTETLHVKF